MWSVKQLEGRAGEFDEKVLQAEKRKRLDKEENEKRENEWKNNKEMRVERKKNRKSHEWMYQKWMNELSLDSFIIVVENVIKKKNTQLLERRACLGICDYGIFSYSFIFYCLCVCCSAFCEWFQKSVFSLCIKTKTITKTMYHCVPSTIFR